MCDKLKILGPGICLECRPAIKNICPDAPDLEVIEARLPLIQETEYFDPRPTETAAFMRVLGPSYLGQADKYC